MAKNIAIGEVFKKKASVKWHCTNYGYINECPEVQKNIPLANKLGHHTTSH